MEGFIIGISIFAVVCALVGGIKLAIEEEKSRPENKVVRALKLLVTGAGNAVGFVGLIGSLFLAFVVLIALPVYVVIHFIVKFW